MDIMCNVSLILFYLIMGVRGKKIKNLGWWLFFPPLHLLFSHTPKKHFYLTFFLKLCYVATFFLQYISFVKVLVQSPIEKCIKKSRKYLIGWQCYLFPVTYLIINS